MSNTLPRTGSLAVDPVQFITMSGQSNWIFMLDTNGCIWHAKKANKQWSNWKIIFEASSSRKATYIAAVVNKNQSKGPIIAFLDDQLSLYYSYYSKDKKEWGVFNTDVVDTTDNPKGIKSFEAVSGVYDHFFILDTDGQVWHAYATELKTWTLYFGGLNYDLTEKWNILLFSSSFSESRRLRLLISLKYHEDEYWYYTDYKDTKELVTLIEDEKYDVKNWQLIGSNVEILYTPIANDLKALGITNGDNIWARIKDNTKVLPKGEVFHEYPKSVKSIFGGLLPSKSYKIFVLDKDGVLWSNSYFNGDFGTWNKLPRNAPCADFGSAVLDPWPHLSEIILIGNGKDEHGRPVSFPPKGVSWSLDINKDYAVWNPGMGTAGEFSKSWMGFLVESHQQLTGNTNIKIKDIVFPGSHHSNSKTLTTNMAEDANKWLKAYVAVEGGPPFSSDHKELMKRIQGLAITQHTTVTDQLERGIRYMDLRIDWEDDGLPYSYHTVLGGPVSPMIDEIKTFLMKKTSSKEVLILEIGDLDTTIENPDRLKKFCQLFDQLPVYKRKDKRRLADHSLGEINSSCGGGGIILMIDNELLRLEAAKPENQRKYDGITNEQYQNFWFLNDEFYDHYYPEWNLDDDNAMVKYMQGIVNKYNPKKDPPLFKLQWLRTWTIHVHIVGSLENSLYNIEKGIDKLLPPFLNKNKAVNFNVLYTDFSEESCSLSQAMAINYNRLRKNN